MSAQTTGGSVEIKEDGAALPKTESAPSTETLRILREIEERHGKSKSVVGTFDQTKESEIFLETIKSKGKFFYLKPDYFRCDYDPPDEMTNLILKEAIYVHVPSIKQVERYKFHTPEERDQQLHVMTLGFGFKADDILREYEAKTSLDDPALIEELKSGGNDPAKILLLKATPAATLAETSPFTQIKLWIDKGTLLPQKIWFEDYNGDKTTIKVLDVKFDSEIPASTFEAKFPAGTEMIDKSDL
ncbi:outer membrane lipoprotein carrier protein LolA [Candidatus Sumerlaeota bacterium]|nr:outer membrane lipoprotein carrier protein LolA [Candidatus Sumerlaeota bacterium]